MVSEALKKKAKKSVHKYLKKPVLSNLSQELLELYDEVESLDELSQLLVDQSVTANESEFLVRFLSRYLGICEDNTSLQNHQVAQESFALIGWLLMLNVLHKQEVNSTSAAQKLILKLHDNTLLNFKIALVNSRLHQVSALLEYSEHKSRLIGANELMLLVKRDTQSNHDLGDLNDVLDDVLKELWDQFRPGRPFDRDKVLSELNGAIKGSRFDSHERGKTRKYYLVLDNESFPSMDLPSLHQQLAQLLPELSLYTLNSADNEVCVLADEAFIADRLIQLSTLFGQEAKTRSITKEESSTVNSMKTLKIFIASSSELSVERDQLELMISRLNDLYMPNIYLKTERWENLLAAVSKTHSQDEYNKVIRQCDAFICVFSNKAGSYSQEEFHVAYDHFSSHDKPFIFTYFQQFITASLEDQERSNTLWNFQKELKAMGHFVRQYADKKDLVADFKDQLQKLIQKEFS